LALPLWPFVRLRLWLHAPSIRLDMMGSGVKTGVPVRRFAVGLNVRFELEGILGTLSTNGQTGGILAITPVIPGVPCFVTNTAALS